MKECKDMKFWNKLTRKQILHLLVDSGVKDVDGLNRTFKSHAETRKKGFEPCWDCFVIADKLELEDE